MAVVIIREDLLRDDLAPNVPTYMSYKTHADNDSLYNTPNCWAIYCCGKIFKYLLDKGGLEAQHARNLEKAKVLYDFLDKLPGVLKSGGRVAVLTFHSGEDRLVKKAFKQGLKEGIFSEIAEDVIRPSAEECFQNPRAKSTKMRWAIKA